MVALCPNSGVQWNALTASDLYSRSIHVIQDPFFLPNSDLHGTKRALSQRMSAIELLRKEDGGYL